MQHTDTLINTTSTQRILSREKTLPFTVRIVQDEESLLKAVKIRHSAYTRHLPEFAQYLDKPEPADYEKDVVVFLAEMKSDGSPIGTMRIQSNEFRSLGMEQSLVLPEWISSSSIGEATRLGIANNELGNLISLSILKANFMYCKENDMDFMIVAARRPVNRLYERLLFTYVFPDFIPLKHTGNIPHKIMCFDILNAEEIYRENNHPLLDFAFTDYHPDICIKTKSWI